MALPASSSSSTKQRYLLAAPLAESTQKKYKSAVCDFLTWMFDNDEDAETIEEFDDLLMDYIHELHLSGQGKTKAINTLYGLLTYMPRLTKLLVGSKRAIKGWNKIAVTKKYPPLTLSLTMVIALQMARRKRYDMAVGALLSFDCLLRVGELTNIRREDIADTGDLRISSRHRNLMIRLRRTKTGDNKWVDVRDENVITLVRGLMAKTKPKAKLFNFTSSQFRRVLKGVCLELGLSPLYVPHSLRHGGATHYHHILDMPLEDILMRGRWSSVKSARHYIQSGKAVLLDFEIPSGLRDLARELETDSNILTYLSLSQKH